MMDDRKPKKKTITVITSKGSKQKQVRTSRAERNAAAKPVQLVTGGKTGDPIKKSGPVTSTGYKTPNRQVPNIRMEFGRAVQSGTRAMGPNDDPNSPGNRLRNVAGEFGEGKGLKTAKPSGAAAAKVTTPKPAAKKAGGSVKPMYKKKGGKAC